MTHSYIYRYRKCLSRLGSRNIVGKHNLIVSNQVDLTQVSFNIQGSHNSIVIHPGCQLTDLSFHLYGDHHRIVIGENCQVNGTTNIWAEDHHCLISIGEGTSFEGCHLSATEPESRLIVGKNCMFSYDIDFRTGDSHSLLSKESQTRFNYAKDILIGDHVWVASHCMFTKGAEVAAHSVVANGSLVNKAFAQANVVLAGSPASVIKQDIDWLKERVYQNSNARQLPNNLKTLIHSSSANRQDASNQ